MPLPNTVTDSGGGHGSRQPAGGVGDSLKPGRRRARLSLNEMTQAKQQGLVPGAGGGAGRGLRAWLQLTVQAGEVMGCQHDGWLQAGNKWQGGRVPGESLTPRSPKLGSSSQPPPSSQPSIPITWRTKLLEVVSEDVLPSDLLNRPFLLLYLPWRSQEGTRVESERPFPNPYPIRAGNSPHIRPEMVQPKGKGGPRPQPWAGGTGQESPRKCTQKPPKLSQRGWEAGGAE